MVLKSDYDAKCIELEDCRDLNAFLKEEIEQLKDRINKETEVFKDMPEIKVGDITNLAGRPSQSSKGNEVNGKETPSVTRVSRGRDLLTENILSGMENLKWRARNPTAYPSAMCYAEELERQIKELKIKLKKPSNIVRCHRGHETSSALWDCPMCVETLRSQNESMRKELAKYRGVDN